MKQGASGTMRLFAYHENPESVAALLNALSRQVEVQAFRVVSPLWHLKQQREDRGGFYWADVADADHQTVVAVPGLRRFPGVSRWWLERSYRSAVRKFGPPDFVLVDSPYLEPFAGAIDAPLAYVATDAYRFYAWPVARTARLERALLARARASFPVSELLAEEFESAGADAVTRLPNGVSGGFAELARGQLPVPLDLATIARPRVAVVGMINGTYDWALIERLAEARPGVSFVFIGPNREPEVALRARIDAVFARENVYWLGSKPRTDLPSYLNASDVLLNPLTINEHNDRRFPLRLCEYLATDRPILTTAIHEAKWFAPHVVPFGDAAAALAALDAALGGEPAVDTDQRRAWLEANSWDARATEVLAALEAVAGNRA